MACSILGTSAAYAGEFCVPRNVFHRPKEPWIRLADTPDRILLRHQRGEYLCGLGPLRPHPDHRFKIHGYSMVMARIYGDTMYFMIELPHR
ncbi:MAG: hypothetical protein KBE09_01070 [Candidatus Pacebacteria bacterium]|nr:hypothetical protein [Candidatus Paceibacterota bacterium]